MNGINSSISIPLRHSLPHRPLLKIIHNIVSLAHPPHDVNIAADIWDKQNDVRGIGSNNYLDGFM